MVCALKFQRFEPGQPGPFEAQTGRPDGRGGRPKASAGCPGGVEQGEGGLALRRLGLADGDVRHGDRVCDIRSGEGWGAVLPPPPQLLQPHNNRLTFSPGRRGPAGAAADAPPAWPSWGPSAWRGEAHRWCRGGVPNLVGHRCVGAGGGGLYQHKKGRPCPDHVWRGTGDQHAPYPTWGHHPDRAPNPGGANVRAVGGAPRRTSTP